MVDEIESTPNCPTCLHPLETTGSDTRPYLHCPHCGYIALTT